MSALDTARRLEQMGIVVRSAELADQAKRERELVERGGNRAMRRAAAKAKRRAAR